MSQVAHQTGAYPSFCSMKRLEVFLLSLDGMLVHHIVTPSIKFTGTHLYTWVDRGIVREKVSHKNTMQCAWPGAQVQTAQSRDKRINPGTLTLRSPLLPDHASLYLLQFTMEGNTIKG